MNAQKSELDSLYQGLIVQLPISDVYGQYQMPASLKQGRLCLKREKRKKDNRVERDEP